ncbi:glycosyltransferase [Hyphomonas johnsonii]|nr:glycosyltransferase [Hyphomonas johnsonii]
MYHSPRHVGWTDVAQIAPFACRVHNAADLNIAIYTCATGGYDVPLPHESLIDRASYHFFTDQPTGRAGFWHLAPLVFPLTDPVRCARLHKTSPQRLLPDADIAVWIDGNIAVTGDIARYVDQVVAANASFGLVAHPIRSTFMEEARAIADYGLDTSDTVAKQVGRYVIEGFLGDEGLAETNFMVMDLRRPETQATLDIWRSEIEHGSRRDQLSFDYARWKAGATSEWLFEAGGSVRSNPAFAYISHGGANHADLELLQRMTLPPAFSDLVHDRSLSDARDRARERSVDIVVCVHNAPDDVANCLNALDRTRDSLTRLILVDDGSDPAAASIIAAHADANRNDIVIRHDTTLGYTIAANTGLRASTADYTVLLNSDAVVSQGAIRAMIAAAERDVDSGLAGPLSNAASWQSVPDQVDPTGDYAINDLPPGLTHEDMARRCADLVADPHIFVPALNGFCMAISRKCLQTTGILDETAFPHGYGEETDYCLRAADLGFQSVVATDAYVFHAKSRSFGSSRRRIHSAEGYRRLVERYGKTRLEHVIDMLRNGRRLQAIRTAFARRT